MQINTLEFSQRIPFCPSPIAKRLLQLMVDKKSNLALSCDVTTAEELLAFAEQLGPHICILKTHIDIISDFSQSLVYKLAAIAKQNQFLIFEDRKFADIGNTVKQQYQGGMYHIANWADIINAHTVPGPSVIQGLMAGRSSLTCGLLLIAQMSCAKHLMDNSYIEKTLALAEAYPEFCFGFICQRAFSSSPQWLYLTPGVQLESGQDQLGQHYHTPEHAILHQGCDIIIVGRGIYGADNPKAMATEYQRKAWQAYSQRCSLGQIIVNQS
jgi:uridine monophosphate synthetase